MAIAFTNKAIDAAIVIPPFTSQFLDHGFAVSFKQPDDLVKPWPLTIAVAMINTDWAKPNRELLRNYFTAYLHGVRDYCQAYHGGANRAELIQRLIRTGTETRAELLYEYPWPARDPNGRINVESMLDMQAWYRQNKFSSAQLPAERLADTSFAGYAVQRLGPFVVENQDSKLVGCR
jgi:NitT/TauT family transport system substrate-binding protein